jgi:lipase maturation factor 1
LLQVTILLTGNYAFFNLLSLSLCIWGLDDQTFERLRGFVRVRSLLPEFGDRAYSVIRAAGSWLLIAYIGLGLGQIALMLRSDPGSTIRSALRVLGPFEIVNTYGLFAVMTTARPEIVIEGSNDQEQWLEYSFQYKPGETHRSLPLIAPYHPRLDWQMWFAALGTYIDNPWVSGLMYRILVGDPVVLHLMSDPPFRKPPRYLRAVLYDYRFTEPAERRKTGAVWDRRRQGIWFGPVSLTGR